MSAATDSALSLVNETIEKLNNSITGATPNFSGDAPAPTTFEGQNRAFTMATFAATNSALVALQTLTTEVERLASAIDNKLTA